MKKLIRHDSLADRVLELIRSDITSGRLAPGTLISGSELAEKIGVSRTPVREALLQLEQAGMVKIEKNRGAVVLAASLEDLLEVFQIRLMLEVPSARRAAMVRTDEQLAQITHFFDSMEDAINEPEVLLRLDRDLHAAIARASGNERLVEVLTNLRNLVLTRGVGTTSGARTGRELIEDHRGLVEAITRQDGRAAASEMSRHIKNTAKLLIAQEADGRAGYDDAWVESNLSWV